MSEVGAERRRLCVGRRLPQMGGRAGNQQTILEGADSR